MEMNSLYGQPLEAPAFYSLEITTSCNGECIGCGNVFLHDSQETPLTAKQWMLVLKGISQWAKRIKVTGGEPTLHPEFEQIVRGIESYKIPFSLFTNGLWHNPSKLIEFLKGISTFTGLLISLHGANPSTHAGFSGTGRTFNEVVNNIKLAVSSGLPVSISTVITKSNYNQLKEVFFLAEYLGVEHVAFNRYIGSHPDVDPDTKQLRTAIHDIENMVVRNKSVGYGVCIPLCFTKNQSHGCSAGIAYGTIDPWGRVRPCAHALSVTQKSLLQATIQSLWQSDVLQKWRRLVTLGCEDCKALPICHGGCTALKQISNLERDPLARFQLSEETWLRPCISLPGKARVMPNYEAVEYGETLNLVSNNGTISLSAATRPLLDVIGRFSLEELEVNLGAEVVDFVGYLYTRGMVDLVDTTA